MSRTKGNNREGTQPDRDNYQTPPALALACVNALVDRGLWEPYDRSGHASRVLEPSAGSGSFVRAIYEVAARRPGPIPKPMVVAVDPVYKKTHPDVEWNRTRFEEFNSDYVGGFDLVTGNPPFSLAEDHIELAHSHLSRNGVLAFVLRLGHQVEAWERAWRQWRAHRPRLVLSFAPRPSYNGGANDSTPYGLFCWQRGWRGPTELDVLFWRGEWTGKRVRR